MAEITISDTVFNPFGLGTAALLYYVNYSGAPIDDIGVASLRVVNNSIGIDSYDNADITYYTDLPTGNTVLSVTDATGNNARLVNLQALNALNRYNTEITLESQLNEIFKI